LKYVATRCQILRLKSTKFNFGWTCAPDPLEELTTLPKVDLRGPSSKGRKGDEGKGEGTRGIKRKERSQERWKREGMGRKVRQGENLPNVFVWLRP